MNPQLDLEIPAPAPEVSPDQVELLCTFLNGRGWVKSAQIAAEIHLDERAVRAIAQHSDGRILSGPGCPGYKLFTGATEIEEADLCATRIESQARQMIKRAAAIRRRFHRYARPSA
jgi:hypothetical protein